MVNKEIASLVPIVRRYLQSQPVDKAWLFGSYARGDERADSDVDILVEYSSPTSISLFTISRIAVGMKRILGREVDLVESSRLLPFAKESADHDKILIYERKN